MKTQLNLELVEEPSGRLLVVISDTTPPIHKLALQSEIPAADESLQERRNRIASFFENIRYTLQQRLFPKDTLIYDCVETLHGKKWTNPRYPEA